MPSNYWVPMLGHAFRVLEAFQDADVELGLKGIAGRAMISRTSAFRILYTLEKLGYVTKDPVTGKYRLGLKIAEAARKALSGRKLVPLARPYLQQLNRQFGESVNLAVLQNGEIFYIEILESSHAFRMADTVGSRVPLHSTALGKAIAASLPEEDLRAMLARNRFTRFTPRTITSRRHYLKTLTEVRARGHSFDKEENERGASCVAVPILNSNQRAVAAISVSGPTPRIRAKQRQIVQALKKVSASISSSLNADFTSVVADKVKSTIPPGGAEPA